MNFLCGDGYGIAKPVPAPLPSLVVEVENKESWTWFLELLIGDLGGIDVCGTMTFMSDQQKVCLIYVQFINFCLMLEVLIILSLHMN